MAVVVDGLVGSDDDGDGDEATGWRWKEVGLALCPSGSAGKMATDGGEGVEW